MTLVEMQDEVGVGLDMLPRAMLLRRLAEADVDILVRTRVKQLAEGAAVVERDREEIRIPVGTVVLAVGVRPNRQLFDELEGSDLEVHVVGDAVEPRGIGEAIREGLEAALAL